MPPLILLSPQKFISLEDPFADHVVLLMHMDTAPFVDESGKTIVSSEASLDSSIKKFGSASASFNGQNRIVLPISDDWNFGFDAFTIELSVRFNQILEPNGSTFTPYNQYMIDNGSNGQVLNYYNGRFNFSDVFGAGVLLSGIFTPQINRWYAIAVTRQNNALRMFVDGQLITSNNLANGIAIGKTSYLNLGNYGGGGPYGLNGNLDEIRITKGICRYTENYEVASSPFSLV